MADQKLSELTELAATPASDDEVYIRDVSEEPAAESKRITIENLLAGVSGVPSGVIAMWHGTIANIPAGWLICDGNNGTPNLLAKFVEGVATAATDPGATGGAGTHTHTNPNVGSPTGITTKTDGSGAITLARVTHSHAQGATGSGDNLPPFYDVAFIMKS